jgi:hypothetical protein
MLPSSAFHFSLPGWFGKKAFSLLVTVNGISNHRLLLVADKKVVCKLFLGDARTGNHFRLELRGCAMGG